MISKEGAPSAIEKLRRQWEQGKFLCVGLDPVHEKIPTPLLIPDRTSIYWSEQMRYVYLNFCKGVFLSTKEVVAAYKPNLQFFLGLGYQGILALEELCAFITREAPEVILILDAKFGDTEDTNKHSAHFAFEICGVDAVTLNPLPGKEKGLQAFFNYEDKLFFVLSAMSHPGATELGGLEINGTGGQTLSEYTAQLAGHNWGAGLVVGATRPEAVSSIRAIAPHAPFLSPGVGKQGGDLVLTVQNACDENGAGFLLNVSSGVIYPKCEDGEDYFEAVKRVATDYNRQIQEALQQTT